MNAVSQSLALGCGGIGSVDLDEAQAADVISLALELGIRLFDAAPSYGIAEERLGRFLNGRRTDVWLSTKLGYGLPGVEDWTGPCIAAGIDRALQRLRTDYLDIALLHSCPRETLWRDDIRWALDHAKRQGKLRYYGYSGEGEALQTAIEVPEFDVVMASLNVCDQRVIDEILPRLRGRLFLAKRPLANAPWAHATRPNGQYGEPYWERWQAMNLSEVGLPPGELAVRFAAWQPGVERIVAGTANMANLRQLAEWVSRGPLPTELVDYIRTTFQNRDTNWTGQI